MRGKPAGLPDRDTIRRRIAGLEDTFLGEEDVPEKVLVQSALGYMRRRLDAGRQEVDVTYAVNPPYAFVNLRFERESGDFRYHVLEPTLFPGEAETLARVRERLEARTAEEEVPVASEGDLSASPRLVRYLHDLFVDVLDLYDIEVAESRREAFFYYLQRDLLGLGRSDPVLRDPFIEDVSCNGTGVPLFVFHRVFGSVRTDVVYEGERELNRHILRIAQMSGKHVSIYKPILDTTLKDGSRINLTLGTEVTKKGSTFSIRKFSQDPISPIDLMRFGSIDARQLAWFWHLIENKRSILVSGGTASGKTTLLNALSMFMRGEDKIVSIEDTPEVHLAQRNWIQSVSRAGYGHGDGAVAAGQISLFDLLVAALRQRPEYILVGEVRGREASTLFQAIATGHAAMATIHAGSISELLNRIENAPMDIPRVLFQALDAIVFPAQVVLDGRRVRRVRNVVEILGVDNASGNLLTNEPYRWDPEGDRFAFKGRSFVMEEIGKSTGRSWDEVAAELERKERLLVAMETSGMSAFRDVTRTVNDYYLDREATLERLLSTVGG